ncbi:MAG: ABC transporter permease [Terracidiphilus sp.]
MTPPVESACRRSQLVLLRVASLVVPAGRRADWLEEWRAELWHVRRTCAPAPAASWRTEREIAGFCFGAFQDAACLRSLWWQNRPRFAPLHGSAARCLLWLGGLLLVSYLASLLLPGVRAEHDFSSAPIRPGTILIQDAGANDNWIPTMAIGQVQIWKRERQHYVDEFAYYRVARESVELGRHAGGTWQIAQATSNLFTLAGWSPHSIDANEKAPGDMPRLVLSERIWRQQFGASPGIVGTVLLVGSRPARVVGVAPGDAFRLPGNSDAWLLKPDSEISPKGRGYVVAHLTRSGRSEMWSGLVNIASYDSRRAEHDFLGKSLEEQTPGPWKIYWFAVLLAFLALPAIASVSLAEYSFSAHKPSWSRRAVRLGFLAIKIALIMFIANFSSVDLAYWHSPVFSPSGAYVQLLTAFAVALFGMRWALLDQRRRCPVCLRLVTNPARVGLASRTFLAWNGTELMCSDGHTLLHIPGLPTSWFSTQRWLYLDTSWDFLFAGSGAG